MPWQASYRRRIHALSGNKGMSTHQTCACRELEWHNERKTMQFLAIFRIVCSRTAATNGSRLKSGSRNCVYFFQPV